MRRIAEFLGGLALVAGLAALGSAASAGLQLPVPGPVLGLLAYIALLSLGVFPASADAARWLSGLIGALIVPPLVGIAGVRAGCSPPAGGDSRSRWSAAASSPPR